MFKKKLYFSVTIRNVAVFFLIMFFKLNVMSAESIANWFCDVDGSNQVTQGKTVYFPFSYNIDLLDNGNFEMKETTFSYAIDSSLMEPPNASTCNRTVKSYYNQVICNGTMYRTEFDFKKETVKYKTLDNKVKTFFCKKTF